MIKKIIFIVLGLVLLVAVGFVILVIHASESPHIVAGEFRELLLRDTAGMYLAVDGEVKINHNGNDTYTLASVVKLPIALHYVQEATKDPEFAKKKISLDWLDQFYVPNTDGGAHQAWIEDVTRRGVVITENEKRFVPLHEVARGMIEYSSNANYDALLVLFGQEKLELFIEEVLVMNDHSPLVPLTSSLIMTMNNISVLNNDFEVFNEQAWGMLYEMNKSNELAKGFAQKLENGTFNDPKYDQALKEWGSKLSRGSPENYAEVLGDVIGTEEYDHELLNDIFQSPFHRYVPGIADMIPVMWGKGGELSFGVVGQAYYVQLDDNTTLEYAHFINDLIPEEQVDASSKMQFYDLILVINESFRNETITEFNEYQVRS